jgi:hypothetical protein
MPANPPRETLARILAREGLMSEVADAYTAARAQAQAH